MSSKIETLKNVLRPNSLASKIYFLLLTNHMTVSDLSRIIYDGKVQLTQIVRVIDKLSKLGYIKEYTISREERRERGIDLRKKYWKANYSSLIVHSTERLASRIKESKPKSSDIFSDEELRAFEIILESKWFSHFFNKDYLELDREVDIKKGDHLLSSNPLQFFSFLAEEIGAIKIALSPVLPFNPSCSEIIEISDFDRYCEIHRIGIDEKLEKKINLIIKKAKRRLGNYNSTNKKIDIMMENYNLLFIPIDLAMKIFRIGRIPLTVFLAFESAVEK